MNNNNEKNTEVVVQKPFFNKRKMCYVCDSGSEIDYKNIKLLSQFVTKRGKIMPSRISGVCSKHQRQIKKAIRRARVLGLLPFVNKV